MLLHTAELEIKDKRQKQEAHIAEKAWKDAVMSSRNQSNKKMYRLTLIALLAFRVICFFSPVALLGAQEWDPAWGRRLEFPPERDFIGRPPPIPPSSAAYSRMISTYVPETLAKIQRADVNNDGLINCIDYAMQFYLYYPEKQYLQIIWNKNSKNGFNHLFVSIWGSDVEPSTMLNRGVTSPHSVSVADAFGYDKYDRRYNVDVTDWFMDILMGRQKW
jgi:hypothetical protein